MAVDDDGVLQLEVEGVRLARGRRGGGELVDPGHALVQPFQKLIEDVVSGRHISLLQPLGQDAPILRVELVDVGFLEEHAVVVVGLKIGAQELPGSLRVKGMVQVVILLEDPRYELRDDRGRGIGLDGGQSGRGQPCGKRGGQKRPADSDHG
jgi:hypothetical protein